MFSKLVIVVLLAVTLGLYLKIVILDEPMATPAVLPPASVQVVEHKMPATPVADKEVREVAPEEPMLLIKRVFAPELVND